MSADRCQLCHEHEGTPRDGRLGRYAFTCDACEERRGTHLVPRSSGYAAIEHLPSMQWARTSPGWASSVLDPGGRSKRRRTARSLSRVG